MSIHLAAKPYPTNGTLFSYLLRKFGQNQFKSFWVIHNQTSKIFLTPSNTSHVFHSIIVMGATFGWCMRNIIDNLMVSTIIENHKRKKRLLKSLNSKLYKWTEYNNFHSVPVKRHIAKHAKLDVDIKFVMLHVPFSIFPFLSVPVIKGVGSFFEVGGGGGGGWTAASIHFSDWGGGGIWKMAKRIRRASQYQTFRA